MGRVNLIISFFVFAVTVNAQSYVKIADRDQYEKYLEYCNAFVPVEVWQVGRVKLKPYPDGTYQDSTGNYNVDKNYKILWYVIDMPKYADSYKHVIDKPVNIGEGINPDSVVGYHVKINRRKVPIGYKALINPFTIYVHKRKHSIRDFYEYWLTDSIEHTQTSQ